MQKQALHNIQLEQRQLCLNDNLCHPKSFFHFHSIFSLFHLGSPEGLSKCSGHLTIMALFQRKKFLSFVLS